MAAMSLLVGACGAEKLVKGGGEQLVRDPYVVL